MKFLITDKDYWYKKAQNEIKKRSRLSSYSETQRPINYAKNVIYFVGDGMGISTLTAARIYGGQRLGKSGEEHNLAWDSFPALGLAKVTIYSL